MSHTEKYCIITFERIDGSAHGHLEAFKHLVMSHVYVPHVPQIISHPPLTKMVILIKK